MPPPPTLRGITAPTHVICGESGGFQNQSGWWPHAHYYWHPTSRQGLKQNTPPAKASGVLLRDVDQPLTRMKTGPEPTLALNSAVVDPFHPP